jgi:hypothetical protein
MGYGTVVALIAALDAFVIAALACVCLVPFRVDRHTAAPRRPLFASDLEAALVPEVEAA